MVPTRLDPRPTTAPAAAQALWALALAVALSGAAGAAPLRLSLETVASPGLTAEAVAPVPALASPHEESGQELSFVAAPDLPFPELPAATSMAPSDDDWLQSARVQHDEPAGIADRGLGGFAPAVVAVLTISTDPIDGVTLPAARPEAAAAEVHKPALREPAGGLPTLAWAAVPVLALSMMAAALWRGRRRRGGGSPGHARSAA